MNPAKVVRAEVKQLTDLPNIGKACAADLRLLGIETPAQLLGRNPYEMYITLCDKTGLRHDPCVLDVFLSITRFMAGDDPKPWWFYTEERKQTYGRI
ncbi:helix-hairpin-helix domain-containing protein [Shewanella sp.]|uniref:helix-hairpin-helix domain-containing protein n=1 Tax=Shewanella sp. TaxID=50422 RepID=UPI003A89782B